MILLNLIRAEPGKKKKGDGQPRRRRGRRCLWRRGRDLTEDEDGVLDHDIASGVEVEKLRMEVRDLMMGRCSGRRSAVTTIIGKDRRSAVVAGV
jgi:hypothetical protein